MFKYNLFWTALKEIKSVTCKITYVDFFQRMDTLLAWQLQHRYPRQSTCLLRVYTLVCRLFHSKTK